MRTLEQSMAVIRCYERCVRKGLLSPGFARELVEWEERNMLRPALEADNLDAAREAWRRAYLGPGIRQEELFA